MIGGLATLCLIAWSGLAQAQTIHIVALGDSNFGAPGVSRDQAYPAQMERLLRARGIDAEVTNQGVNGDTTGGVMARLGSAVPDGTDVVILSVGVNDFIYNHTPIATIKANVQEIARRLRARGIVVVVLKSGREFQGALFKRPEYHVEGQGGATGPAPGTTKWHLTAQGYAIIAKQTLPQVLTAVGQAKKRHKG